jgi:hypothetical protein
MIARPFSDGNGFHFPAASFYTEFRLRFLCGFSPLPAGLSICF